MSISYSQGACGFLSKPFSMSELVRHVEFFSGTRNAADAGAVEKVCFSA